MSYSQRAIHAIDCRQFKLAEEIIRTGLNQSPNDVSLHLLMSHTQLRLENYVQAREAARNSIELAPSMANGYEAMAWAVLSDSDYTPKASEPWVDFDQLKAKDATRQRIEIGKQLCETAIAMAPTDADSYYLLSQVFWMQDNPTEALAAAEQGISFDLQHAGCWHQKIMLLEELGRVEEAKQCGLTRLQQSPLDPDIHRQLARAHISTGDLDAALVHSRQAIELAPTSTEARQMYWDTLAAKQKWLRPIVGLQKITRRWRQIILKRPYISASIGTLFIGVTTAIALAVFNVNLFGWILVGTTLIGGLILSDRPLMGLVDLWLIQTPTFRAMLDPLDVKKKIATESLLAFTFAMLIILVGFQNWQVPAYCTAILLIFVQGVCAWWSPTAMERWGYLAHMTILALLLWIGVSGMIANQAVTPKPLVYVLTLVVFGMMGVLGPCFLYRSLTEKSGY